MVGSLMFGMFPEHLAGSVLSSVCSCLDGQVYGSCCSSPLRLLFVASNDVSAELPFSKSNAASPLLLLLLLFLLLLLAGRAVLGDASTTKQAATTNRTTITMAPLQQQGKKSWVGLEWKCAGVCTFPIRLLWSGLVWIGPKLAESKRDCACFECRAFVRQKPASQTKATMSRRSAR